MPCPHGLQQCFGRLGHRIVGGMLAQESHEIRAGPLEHPLPRGGHGGGLAQRHVPAAEFDAGGLVQRGGVFHGASDVGPPGRGDVGGQLRGGIGGPVPLDDVAPDQRHPGWGVFGIVLQSLLQRLDLRLRPAERLDLLDLLVDVLPDIGVHVFGEEGGTAVELRRIDSRPRIQTYLSRSDQDRHQLRGECFLAGFALPRVGQLVDLHELVGPLRSGVGTDLQQDLGRLHRRLLTRRRPHAVLVRLAIHRDPKRRVVGDLLGLDHEPGRQLRGHLRLARQLLHVDLEQPIRIGRARRRDRQRAAEHRKHSERQRSHRFTPPPTIVVRASSGAVFFVGEHHLMILPPYRTLVK